jgi:hypothetical protein
MATWLALAWHSRSDCGFSSLLVRLLAGLLPGWQVRVPGKPPVVVDGDTLAPEVQLTLALLERRGAPSPNVVVHRGATGAPPSECGVGLVEEVEVDASVPLRGRASTTVNVATPAPRCTTSTGTTSA